MSAAPASELLFGADPTQRLVAVEATPAGEVVYWQRHGADVERHTAPLEALLWVEDPHFLDEFDGDYKIQPLAGDLPLAHVVRVRSGKELEALKRHLVGVTGDNPSNAQAPYLYVSDRVHLHLMSTGTTLFKGMRFDDVRRLQIDILAHAAPGDDAPRADCPEDRILSIALTDTEGYREVLDGSGEQELITKLAQVIGERDPDIIEGHNFYKQQLEYLRRRAERYKLGLAWGRDGSNVRFRRSRVQIAERTIDFPLGMVYGRHCVDTWVLTQFYDLGSGRGLGGYELADVAPELGLAPGEFQYRTPFEREALLGAEPERHRQYHLELADQVAALSKLLQASYFVQAQIFPYSYHQVMVRGQATKINALMLREYLRRGQSVPKPPEVGVPIVGGFTALGAEGIVEPIVHCDVSSLYPSVMLAFQIQPRDDSLSLFLELLGHLRTMRLEAKARLASATDPVEAHHLEALQSTLKIVINSFYGFLGSPFPNWADTEAANAVTAKGRELVQSMMRWLEGRGAKSVEVDTDGVYFVPPPAIRGEAAERAFIAELGAQLPEGIDVELAGRYRSMLSYKVKNYALLGYDGQLRIAGSGLRSRGVERYLRRFLREAIRLALDGRAADIEAFYEQTMVQIAEHRAHITDLMKTETLSDSLAEYQRKIGAGKRNRGAAYELALAAERDYRPGDQLSYYVTGDKKRVKVYECAKPVGAWNRGTPDENVAYYQQKLADTFKKFAPILGVEVGQRGLGL